MVRRLAIIGASCTGKTTLFEELRAHYRDHPQLAFVPEAARDYFIEHGIPSTFSFETQRAIQAYAKQREEVAAQSGAQLVVSDSSVMEPIFYTQLAGDNDGARRLEALAADWMRGYELLMCDPDDISFENDGLRSEDKTFRDTLAQTYKQFLSERSIPYTLISGDLATRLSRAKQLIGH